MEKELKERRIGMVAIIVANVCWGLMAPFSKSLLNAGTVSALALTGLRIISGAALLWAIGAVAPDSWGARAKLERADIWKVFVAGMLVIAANQSLVVIGMSLSSPIDVVVMCSVTPIFTVLISLVLLRQRLKWLRALGVALGFGGMLALVLQGSTGAADNAPNPMLGNSLCLLAQFCGAMYLVMFAGVIKRYPALTMMKWMFLFAAIVIAPLTLGDILSIDWSAVSTRSYIDMAYIILIGTCLCYLLLPLAQRQVNPTAIAMCNYLQPVVGSVSAALAGLGVITWEVAACSVLIFVGIGLVSKSDK